MFLLVVTYIVTSILWGFRCMSFLNENSDNVLEIVELFLCLIYLIPILLIILIISFFVSEQKPTFERFKKKPLALNHKINCCIIINKHISYA